MENLSDIPEENLTDRVRRRAEAQRELWREVQAGDVPRHTFDLSVNEWIAQDCAAFHECDDDQRHDVAAVVATNMARCPTYAEMLLEMDQQLAEAARPAAEMLTVASVYSDLIHLLPEKLAERVSEAPAALQALLGDAIRMREMDSDLAAHFNWLPPTRLIETHAALATALHRDDAAERQQEARNAIEHARGEPSAERDDHEAQRIADFIAANKGLLSWKIEGNVEKADQPLRVLLADANNMSRLDDLLREKLSGISPVFVADVHAIIAAQLRRPDAANRAREAALLHQDQPQLEPAAPPHPSLSPDITGETAVTDVEPVVPHAPPTIKERVQTELPLAPAAECRNGFMPGAAGLGRREVSPVGDLLERMSHKSRNDGTVLYLIDQYPAFVDHGDQLLMAHGASSDEHAILGAILLAAEKYKGVIEITGTKEFTRQAISIMLKYQVAVRLKSPVQDKLRQSMEQEDPVLYRTASPEAPVAPIEFRAITPPQAPKPCMPSAPDDDTTLPAPTPNSADPLAGTIVALGNAPYLHESGKALSFFVTLENADGQQRTSWGLDLARAIRKASVQVGDKIVLHSLGPSAAKVLTPVFDANGNFTGTVPARSRKVSWEIEVPNRTERVTRPRREVQDTLTKTELPTTASVKRTQRTRSSPERAPTASPLARTKARRAANLSMKH